MHRFLIQCVVWFNGDSTETCRRFRNRMGYLDIFRLKRKRNGTGSYVRSLVSFLVFMVAVRPQAVRPAQHPSLSLLNETKVEAVKSTSTSTIRPWPAHEFFLNVISESTRRNGSRGNNEGVVEHSQDPTDSIKSGNASSQSESRTQNEPISRQWLFPTLSPLQSDPEERRIYQAQVPHIEAGIPLRVFNTKQYQHELDDSSSAYGKVSGAYNFQQTPNPSGQFVSANAQALPTTGPDRNGWTRITRVTRKPFQEATQHERPPLQYGFPPSRNPTQAPQPHFGITLSEEGLPPSITFADPIRPMVTGASNDPGLKKNHATTIWYKPTINHYDKEGTETKSKSELRPAGSLSEPVPELMEKPASDKSEILFKIWSYENGEVSLHSQKEIPSWVLQGYNISDGQMLNMDDVPYPVKELVASALNSSSGVFKRHSGPGNDYHWQRLPVILPEQAPLRQPPQTVTRKPVSLNYVIWPHTTPAPRPASSFPDYVNMPNFFVKRPAATPGYNLDSYWEQQLMQMTTPTPPLKDSGLESWLKLQCYLKDKMGGQTPPIPNLLGNAENMNKVPDPELMTNLAALSIILTRIKKGDTGPSAAGGISDYPESPKNPISSINSGVLGMKPPHRDAFWSSLYPIYQHLVNKGLAASSIIKGPEKRPRPRPRPDKGGPFDEEYEENVSSALPEPPNNYNFYQNQDIISITENPDSPEDKVYKHRHDLLKVAKKGLKKFKKKGKKKGKKGKKGGGWSSYLNPANLNVNANFGIDVLGLLQKKFLALLALNIAPTMMMLSTLSFLPLIILILPKLLGWLKLGHKVYQHFKDKFHHSHPHHGWHGWDPHRHSRGKRVHKGATEYHHHYHRPGWPKPAVDSLVQASYGNSAFGTASPKMDFRPMGPSGDSPYYDADLDTIHNRRVMEILMENKNASLHKLLASWALGNSTILNKPIQTRKKRSRKRRAIQT